MKKLMCMAAAALALAASTGAAAEPSAASVERLMQVMKVQSQLDAMYAQAVPQMQNAMRQALAAELKPDEATRRLNAIAPRVNAVVREEMSWSKLKPDFAQLYQEMFTQQEVDGLIAFYEGPIGAALVDKMPQVSQKSMLMMQRRMGPVMQRVAQITREEGERARQASAVRH